MNLPFIGSDQAMMMELVQSRVSYQIQESRVKTLITGF